MNNVRFEEVNGIKFIIVDGVIDDSKEFLRLIERNLDSKVPLFVDFTKGVGISHEICQLSNVAGIGVKDGMVLGLIGLSIKEAGGYLNFGLIASKYPIFKSREQLSQLLNRKKQ